MRDPRAPDAIGAVLHARLGALVADLHVRDGEVRDRVPDGVHQARVTTRRLRGALASFRAVLLADVTRPISGDLRWLAAGLGDARDAEVVVARLRPLATEEVDPEHLDAVRLRLDRLARDLEESAWRQVESTLAAERHHALLVALDRLVAHPPWAKAASRPATDVLGARLAAEAERLDRRVDRALASREHPGAYDEAVHDVRKAAKRLRYAWEVAEPVLGEPASVALASTREVTRLLGERQDSVLTRAVLARLEAAAAADGEPTEPWSRLRRGEAERSAHIASETLDMLKSGTLSAGVAVREK